MTIDMGLMNKVLYDGTSTEEVAGRMVLTTPVNEAVNIVGRNVTKMIDAVESRKTVTLTGPMAVWSYLVVFHAVVHRFDRVYYDDGRNGPILVAQHGA